MSRAGSWRSFLGCLILVLCMTKTYSCYTNPGYIQLDYPDEPKNFEIGSDIYVTCGLKNNTFTTADERWHTRVDHSNLRFRIFGRSLDETSEFVEKVDENTIAYVKKNATPNDTTTLMCFGQGLNEFNNATTYAGCYRSIYVGTPPKNVLNFECTSISFVNMTCSWKNPENKVRTEYTIEISYGVSQYLGPRQLWKGCPGDQTTPNSCSWSADTIPSYDKMAQEFFFRINGTNALGNGSWDYKFKHKSIVKLSPIKNLSVNITSPRKATVKWDAPDETKHGGWKEEMVVEYLVIISRANSSENRTTLANDRVLDLEDLLPNYEYRVSVSARTNESRRFELESDPVATTLHMPKDIPDKPPALASSAFKYKLFDSVRTVTVLFSETPRTNWNDDHFEYTVQVCSRVDESCYNRTVNQTNVELEDLSVTKQYYVNIWSVNSLGSSPTSSELIIRPQSELLPAPTNLQAVVDTHTVTLTWTTPKTLENQTLYADVYWCKTSNERSCLGEIHTKRVKNEDSYRIEVDDTLNYIYGVALSHHDGPTSGSVWSVCEIKAGAKVGQVRELEALSDTDTTLKLRWKTGCGYQRKDVAGYQVEYCRIEQHAEDVLSYVEKCHHRRPSNASASCRQSNFSVSTEEDIFTLEGLQTGEVYRVVLRAIDSETGKFAPDSMAACARAQGRGFSGFTLILIIIGSALGFSVIILVIMTVAKHMGGELHSTKMNAVRLPGKTNKLDKLPHCRETEMKVIESNGVHPEIDVHMPSAFNSGSHSSLDKLIPVSNFDSLMTQKDSVESPNLKGEPQTVLNMELPKTTDARAPPVAAVRPAVISQQIANGIPQYPASTMPPYTQLGLSATHFVAAPEQPRNTGYSQLSVIPSAQAVNGDHDDDDVDDESENRETADDNSEDRAPSPEPEALPRRPPNNPGYVAFDVTYSDPPRATSNGYVPAVRARQ